ncbi:unnamed protein product, partial [Musa acuminata var. zebrina]
GEERGGSFKFDDPRESPISAETRDELIENHVIVCRSAERYYVTILSFVDKDQLNWTMPFLCTTRSVFWFNDYANNYTTQSGRETNHSKLSTPNLLFNCPSSKVVTVKPCLWNGLKRPCYLFARKFYPEALHNLMQLFSNYTLI